MSPEIWNNRPYNGASDMWALGCMIYGYPHHTHTHTVPSLIMCVFACMCVELAALRPPFLGANFNDLRVAIAAGRMAPLPALYSEALRRVVSSLLRPNPADRPTASALLKSPDLVNKSLLEGSSSAALLNKENELMRTIVVPVNLRKLGVALPKPCYPDIRPHSPAAWTVAAQKQLAVQTAIDTIATETKVCLPMVSGMESRPMRPVPSAMVPAPPAGQARPPLRTFRSKPPLPAQLPGRVASNRVIW